MLLSGKVRSCRSWWTPAWRCSVLRARLPLATGLAYFDSIGYDVSSGMNVDVVKGNHHGSCNGINSRFLDLTSPSWITFGVSATNGYHHVHTQTKDLLSGRSTPLYRSDGTGCITFTTPRTPGGGYSVSVEKGVASMSGVADETSSQSAYANL